MKVIHYIPTKPDSIPEQIAEMEDVITKKPSGILFVPVDFRAMVSSVQKVNQAGIPIVNASDKVPSGETVGFVGADDYNMARATARRLMAEMKGQGSVIILEGVKGTITSTERVRGFTDVIAEFPSVKVVASQSGNFQRLSALQVTENLLQSHPKVDGILAANDAMATGAIEALDGAKRTALVIGLNGTKEAIDAILAGKMLASGLAEPFLQGCYSTRILVQYLRKQPIPTKPIFLDVVVADPANAASLNVPVESRACPQLPASAL